MENVIGTVKPGEHLSLVQITILNAIKSGCKTVEEIAEKTGMVKSSLTNVINDFVNAKRVIAENGEYHLPVREGKRYKMKGNCVLPISTFRDSEGKMFVCRGEWTPMPEGCTLDDIDWIDTGGIENEIQIISRGVKEQKLKEKKAALPNIKDEDGEPFVDDLKCLGAWRPVNDHIKIWPIEASSKRAIIEISPRFITDNGVEFPYGAITIKKVITIEVLRELLNGDTTNLPRYSVDEVMLNLPNSLPVKPYEHKGEVVGWEYLSTKKSPMGVKIIHYGFQITPKNKFTTIDSVELSRDNAMDYIKSIATAFITAGANLENETTKKS